jgi:DNA-binding MarR family transcriptional regulator
MPDDAPRVITLISLFRSTARLMVDELIERLHAAGYDDTSAAHHPVFENIDQEGTRLTTLAARTRMTHQSMGELVGVLEARGYLERASDPDDGRARLVRLTPKGRQLVRRAVAEIEQIEAVWIERYRRAGFEVELNTLLQAGLQGRQPKSEIGAGDVQ